MKKTNLAIFDIDGTVFRSSLLIEQINGLVENLVFPKKATQEIEKEYLAWLDRKGDYEAYLKKVIDIHLKYISGKKQSEVEAVAKQTVEFLKDRVYRYTRDLIKKLKSQGYYIISISGSPTYIVSKYARALGFKAYFGSQYEIKNGIFSGRVLNQDTFYKKSEVLTGFIDKANFKADLRNSVAVGDTESDIPMLEMVGKPIAFNPNAQLASYAKKKGWPIIIERKDVIYRVKSFDFAKACL